MKEASSHTCRHSGLQSEESANAGVSMAGAAANSNHRLKDFLNQLSQFLGSRSVLEIEWSSADSVRFARHNCTPLVTACPVTETSLCGKTLPMQDESFDTVLTFATLDMLTDDVLPLWLRELYRVCAQSLWVALETRPGRNRSWWEQRFLEAGFRKHLLSLRVQSYADLEIQEGQITMLFEKVPAQVLARYPLSALAAERNLHMDMLRETGSRSDAHLARYQLAAEHAKDAEVIVDAACGLGYGSAMLARQFPNATVIGVDNSEYAVAYARDHFASILPNLEFHQADACDLRWLANRRIDFLVSFETIEHVPDPDRFLQQVAEHMSPGARFIGSVPNKWVDETGGDPNPYHLYVFDFMRFGDLLNRHFKVTRVFRQNAERGVKGNHGRILREIVNGRPNEDDRKNAEWWLLAADAVLQSKVSKPASSPAVSRRDGGDTSNGTASSNKSGSLASRSAAPVHSTTTNGNGRYQGQSPLPAAVPGCPSKLPIPSEGDKPQNICLATNYMLMTPTTSRLWTDLDRHLAEFGTRLVLLTTAEPQSPLTFPVISLPYLIRDYARIFPLAVHCGGMISEYDWQLLAADRSRSGDAYPEHEVVPGLLACRHVMNTVLETLQPGYVLSWDSTTPLAVVLHSLCTEMGIPIQALERGLLPETLAIESHGNVGWTDLRTHWLADEMSPRAGDSVVYDQICSYYRKFRPEKYPQPDFVGGEELRRRFNLGDKKAVVFFGHGDCGGLVPGDSSRRRYISPEFASTNDALTALSGVLENDPNVALIFKPHPVDKDPYVIAKLEGVHVARDVNVHSLIDLADIVVAQFTTLQYEAALYDKPVVLLGRSAWWGRNATYEADRRQDLRRALKGALEREDWAVRSANARAFLAWAMDQFLIASTPTVPARRKLRDLARFIVRTSLDPRHLPGAVERWDRTEEALTRFREPTAQRRNKAPVPATALN